jgi:hypothetical protein
MKLNITTGLVASFTLAATAAAQITTFDNGRDGWSVSGRTDVSPTGGNPGANLDVFLDDVFGMTVRNDDMPLWFDPTQPATYTVDVKVDSISGGFIGNEVPRDFGLSIQDTDDSGTETTTGLFFPLGTLTSSAAGWQTYSVTINDPTSVDLPASWIGTGDLDSNFEPVLTAGRTFADVLATADSIEFTTFTPGFFFGFTDFDVQVDNVGAVVIPEPATASLLGLLSLAVLRRRR